MEDEQCALCDGKPERFTSTSEGYRFVCAKCGLYVANGSLRIEPSSIHNRYLLSGYAREYWEVSKKRDYVRFQDSNIMAILAQCPQTIEERAHKLLLAIHRRTHKFGQAITLKLIQDYPLAYAKDASEAEAFSNYLRGREFVTGVVSDQQIF